MTRPAASSASPTRRSTAPHERKVVDLTAQQIWTRDVSKRGQRAHYATRPYQEKESYKWEQTAKTLATRLGSTMANVISVCDREADIYEYLNYKQKHTQRFVVRSMQSRCCIFRSKMNTYSGLK